MDGSPPEREEEGDALDDGDADERDDEPPDGEGDVDSSTVEPSQQQPRSAPLSASQSRLPLLSR